MTIPDVVDAEFADMPSEYDMPAAETPAEPNRKPCPACGEMIVATASKCRFCGEILDARALKVKGVRSTASSSTDDDMTTGDWVVAVLCSGIGCIAGIVWMIQGKPKGAKMVGVSILFALGWGAIRAVLQGMNQGNMR